MIHIFFVPGMFGSTVEYALRSFTNELPPEEAVILPDGSMHSFKKQKHITTKTDFINFFNGKEKESVFITTPIYPLSDLKLPEMLEIFNSYVEPDDKCVLIHADTHDSAELNMLFQYYKIIMSPNHPERRDLFYKNANNACHQWNNTYTSHEQMQRWEFREWLSLFYPIWVSEWIDSQNQVSDNFYKVTNSDILHNTEKTLTDIIEHCGLTRNLNDLGTFVEKWKASQEYIRQEYLLINKIVHCTINLIDFSWAELNIFAEAIIQQKFRSLGFEIQCDGLNEFPTNSLKMLKLLTVSNG